MTVNNVGGGRTAVRIGALCAILGSVASVAGGTGFGNRTNDYDPRNMLDYLAGQPEWLWPLVYTGFIVGALLWVGAFVTLSGLLTRETSRTLARLGTVSVIIGVGVHIVDAAISGYGLNAIAQAWASAPEAQRPELLTSAQALMWVLGGTWNLVLALFHGLPFVLVGLAVVLDRGRPAWFRWFGLVAVAAGIGSLVIGALGFLVIASPGMSYVAFAVAVSVWMVVVGVAAWRRSAASIPV